MKAAIFKAPYEFEICEREIPKPKEHEVLIRIRAVGICGSDIHPYRGNGLDRREPGIIMGHEATGDVAEIGGKVTRWKPGDRVAVNPQINCEFCIMCRKGLPHLCDHPLLIGSSMRGFLDGAMCEYLVMHEKQLYHLPDEVSYDYGTFLDPLGNAIHLINRGGVKLGDKVVITGAGTIGLLAVQTARLAGAVKVIAVDLSDYKLGIAKDVGATCCLKSDDPDFLEKVKQETDGMGPDVVVEAVGISTTYNLALQMCRKRGTVVALGFTKPELELAIQQIVYKELHVFGSTGYADECGTTLEYLKNNMVDIEKVITHRLPLEKVKEGFDLLCEPDSKAIKVILNP
ncbi:zinc-binding dehydrogenase [Schaedlerella sp.]|uniref:zinc-dependent alcohol dehydrogenase n=1 Tax=Schaedlerella sp. TaxID=2676057 RepID=UPI001362F50C|nr:alcohol dehydrogenase catalytic domain-containing protein [Ruminococcus sp.]NBJ02300.1 hypothetical protein [Lachnospiraceae bacterium]